MRSLNADHDKQYKKAVGLFHFSHDNIITWLKPYALGYRWVAWCFIIEYMVFFPNQWWLVWRCDGDLHGMDFYVTHWFSNWGTVRDQESFPGVAVPDDIGTKWTQGLLLYVVYQSRHQAVLTMRCIREAKVEHWSWRNHIAMNAKIKRGLRITSETGAAVVHIKLHCYQFIENYENQRKWKTAGYAGIM